MDNIVSLSGASSGKKAKAAWCIPSMTELGGQHMPIVMLVMTSEGPRYLPTRVMAPVEIRKDIGTYEEISMSEQDLELQNAVFNWVSASFVEPAGENMPLMEQAMSAANDVSAAARFLNIEYWSLELQDDPVIDDYFYLGRSIHIRSCGENPQSLPAWIVSGEDVHGHVELVARTAAGIYHRISADGRALIEDGTAAIVCSE